jgi:hypothetical protein
MPILKTAGAAEYFTANSVDDTILGNSSREIGSRGNWSWQHWSGTEFAPALLLEKSALDTSNSNSN